MIVHPTGWKEIGNQISLARIEETLIEVLDRLQVYNLSFSGGLDSSLLLYFMVRVYGREKVRAFTVASSKSHPDYWYSELVTNTFNVKWIPYIHESGDPGGDKGVEWFYRRLMEDGVETILTGDGIDEYLAGYYGHQESPSDLTYFTYLRRLFPLHLAPLNENSGKVKVYLPYLDKDLILLWSAIPLSEKVDSKRRKKVLVQLAKNKLPEEVIYRKKYGFCDAFKRSWGGRYEDEME